MIGYSYTLTCPDCGSSESISVRNLGTPEVPSWQPAKALKSFRTEWKGSQPAPVVAYCADCNSTAICKFRLQNVPTLPKITRSESTRRDKAASENDLPLFKSRAELNLGLRKFERWVQSVIRDDEAFVDNFRILSAEIDYGAQFDDIQRAADQLLRRAAPEDLDYASRRISLILERDSSESDPYGEE